MTDFFCKVPASHNYYFISFVYIAPIFLQKQERELGPLLENGAHYKLHPILRWGKIMGPVMGFAEHSKYSVFG